MTLGLVEGDAKDGEEYEMVVEEQVKAAVVEGQDEMFRVALLNCGHDHVK